MEPVLAGPVDELRRLGRKVVRVGRTPVLVLYVDGVWHAIDNRCPHMGFPLHRGDLEDGILACHWHHARFDVTCGATLDPWADDAETWQVYVEGGNVYVDPARPVRDPVAHGLRRLRRGMEESIRLVSAKAVLTLLDGGVPAREPVSAIARFGAAESERGWQPGLSILAAVANVLPSLGSTDRPRGLVHAAARVARDCADVPPRRPLPGLMGSLRDRAGLRAWFRETVELRDAEGAERVLATLAVREGATAALDAVLAACTDHRYVDGGHALDYAVKCAELAEHIAPAPPEEIALLFTSLVPGLVGAPRMEETPTWRRPLDVAALVEDAWREVRDDSFAPERLALDAPLADEDAVIDILLAEQPEFSLEVLVQRLRQGASPVALAEAVVGAAVMRVLRFGRANEDADWDTVHHTLTYANAVAEGMRRAPSRELFRGVLDGAMSVYLDRFLNVPPAPLPDEDAPAPGAGPAVPLDLLVDLLLLYDGRAAVDEAATMAARFLASGGDPARLLTTLGTAVLREDAEFHEIQQLDIAWRRLQRRGPGRASRRTLAAAARWVASRFPTRRAADQTFDIARRLSRGDELHV